MATSERATIALREILTRRVEPISVQDDVNYKQVTVRVRGRGLGLRGEALGSQIGTKRQFAVAQNDFLVSRIDARNGAFGVVPPELDGAIVTQDFPVFSVDRAKCDPQFLAMLASRPAFWEECALASEGSTNRVRLNVDEFLEIEVDLPSLAEQERAIRGLRCLDLLIGRNRRCVEAGYALLAALQTELFSRVEADQLPIGDFAKIATGGTPSTSHAEYFGGAIPWVNTSDVAFRDIESVPKSITELGLKNSSAKLVPAGAVLVAMYGRGTVGRSAVLTKPMATNQACAAIHPSDKHSARYLFHFLWSSYGDLIDAAEGSTNLTNISKGIIEEFEVPLPSAEEQQAVAEMLDACLDDVRAAEAELETLSAVRTSLIEELVTGEHLVSENGAARIDDPTTVVA